MAYNDIDDDSAEALYREKVRARLVRTHKGLSLGGMIGTAIAVAVGVIYFSVPVATHHPGKIEADIRRANSICDRTAGARDEDRCRMPLSPPDRPPS